MTEGGRVWARHTQRFDWTKTHMPILSQPRHIDDKSPASILDATSSGIVCAAAPVELSRAQVSIRVEIGNDLEPKPNVWPRLWSLQNLGQQAT
jgi:hypothetical protein